MSNREWPSKATPMETLVRCMNECDVLEPVPAWVLAFIGHCLELGWPTEELRAVLRSQMVRKQIKIPHKLHEQGDQLRTHHVPHMADNKFWTFVWAMGDICQTLAQKDTAKEPQWMKVTEEALLAQTLYWQDAVAEAAVVANSGPTHLIALEQQLLAYQVGKLGLSYSRSPAKGRSDSYLGDDGKGALHNTTLTALEAAIPYCWADDPVEAVAAASATLPVESAPIAEALGLLGAPDACGWWWFEQPIPIKTTAKEATGQPVVALLWKREQTPEGMRTWFSTFVWDWMVLSGRRQLVPNPTAAWYWWDGQSLADFEVESVAEYNRIESEGRAGFDAPDVSDTAQATMWFSRFWLSGSLWLQQKVLSVAGQAVPRGPGRQIARQKGMKSIPLVQIVHLRKTMRKPSTGERTDSATREYHCRWVVHGHWRSQWYPSVGKHSPKWIKSYPKGPSDMPFKSATRVYAVIR